MSRVPVVLLSSEMYQSGKSTVASMLKSRGWARGVFARTMKEMLWKMLDEAGMPEEQIEEALHGAAKLKPLPPPFPEGVTPRRLMQTLGTEWREMIGVRLWADIEAHRVRSAVEAEPELPGLKIVYDDWRFPHEMQAMRELPKVEVYCLEVIRDSARVITDGHKSEGALKGIPRVPIYNNGTLEDLAQEVKRVFGELGLVL